MVAYIRLRWDKESTKLCLITIVIAVYYRIKALRVILCSLVLVLYYIGKLSILKQSYVNNIVDDLAGHVQDLVDLFKEVNDPQESALNRRVVPVMELANFIMKQIVDLTKDTDNLFTRLIQKHSK